jgi:GTP-binding protein HflX
MKNIWGKTKGLRSEQLHRLELLYRRRVPATHLISAELNREISQLSHEIQRQIGLMIDRSGRIAYVIVGDGEGIFIPQLLEYRNFPGRLRGIRLIHTHIRNESLTEDDLTDLSILRLDLIAATTVDEFGMPRDIHWAHILPGEVIRPAYQVREVLRQHQLSINCANLIQAIENEMANIKASGMLATDVERALLISVTVAPRKLAAESLDELTELCRSGGISVIDKIIQVRKKVDSRFLIGSGKVNELAIRAMQLGISLLVFDQNLNPSQIRSITDHIDLKVIDRTQLILDIFAQRAQSREGKLQVELAQLKYLLPRLVTKNTAMSRLTGGIGGRGPGETKLEINRRRARERINHLETLLKKLQKQREQQRRNRLRNQLPIISVIGYTNAGKSTLLNTLTKSNVLVENKLFATLDPASRRLRFPKDRDIIITDTVGFIRNLPKDLMVAFRATLEELNNADLLLHIIDISNPRFPDQIKSVESLIEDLGLCHIPQIRVLNKKDRVNDAIIEQLSEQYRGIPICSLKKETLQPLITAASKVLDDNTTAL